MILLKNNCSKWSLRDCKELSLLRLSPRYFSPSSVIWSHLVTNQQYCIIKMTTFPISNRQIVKNQASLNSHPDVSALHLWLGYTCFQIEHYIVGNHIHPKLQSNRLKRIKSFQAFTKDFEAFISQRFVSILIKNHFLSQRILQIQYSQTKT